MSDNDTHAIKHLLADLHGWSTVGALNDLLGRKLVVTPFGGAYGQAGTVIALEGSPPRGVIVSLETVDHKYVPPAIFYLEMDRSRRMGEAQSRTVRRYLESTVDAAAEPSMR